MLREGESEDTKLLLETEFTDCYSAVVSLFFKYIKFRGHGSLIATLQFQNIYYLGVIWFTSWLLFLSCKFIFKTYSSGAEHAWFYLHTGLCFFLVEINENWKIRHSIPVTREAIKVVMNLLPIKFHLWY